MWNGQYPRFPIRVHKYGNNHSITESDCPRHTTVVACTPMLRGYLLPLIIVLGASAALLTLWRGDARADEPDWPRLRLDLFATGLSQPVDMTHTGDGSGRLFVVERAGRVRIIKNGILLPDAFLDIRPLVGSDNLEQGLLGIAFPPGFAEKQHFYLDYTDLRGDTIVARYRVLPTNLNRADPNSAEIILTIAQPFPNHNGGQIAFGPGDGFLYIGMGDGGAGGDPFDNGQNPNTLLGKILRIDVETGVSPYAIPITNPYTVTAGYRGEIWAMGLRNPWRFSFDRLTGDLYIGDVGQNLWEEIDFQAADSAGGENYGWRRMEGRHCYNPHDCDPIGLVLPISEYEHSQGCAVTGGRVYRGEEQPRLRGIYFYADYCSGRLWGLRRGEIAGDLAWQNQLLFIAPFPIAAFGEDQAGNLYIANFRNGALYRLVDSFAVWLPLLHTIAAPTPARALVGRPSIFPLEYQHSPRTTGAMLNFQTHLPTHPSDDPPLLVLLHGRGADESDMLALAPFFPDAIVVAARAPYPAASWGYGPGFAWYRYLGGVRPDPDHYQHSLDELDNLLDLLPGALPIRSGPLVLGGFSQGGTVSLGYALSHPGRVHTLLNLSGFLPDHPAVRVTPETIAVTRFYWPHGTLDPAVPFSYAQEGRAQLLATDACLVAPDYPIAHTLIRAEIDDIRELLRTI